MGPSPDYDPANDPAVTSGGSPEWHNLHGKKQMTPAEYRAALETLGLSQQAAGRWLMVSPKTAQNYAKIGPSGPAARAIMMALTHGLTINPL